MLARGGAQQIGNLFIRAIRGRDQDDTGRELKDIVRIVALFRLRGIHWRSVLQSNVTCPASHSSPI